MTGREKMLDKWLKRLGLQDWTVALQSDCRLDEIVSGGCGETEYTEEIKCAYVRILDEQYYGKRIKPYCYEQTLIHELLHLKFALLDNSGNDIHDRLLHQCIDDLATALYLAESSDDGKSE